VSLRLQLLGPPRVTGGEAITELGSDKPVSVLYYLSQRNDWVSRNELAFLYRPDADDQTALSNVRKWIHRAREHVWAGTLETEKHRVRFQIESDVQAFRQAVMQQRWSDALGLYRGVFLEGVSLSDTPSFEAWLELERADLNRLWQQAAQQHVHDLEQRQDWAEASRVLQGLLRADPLDEDVLQAYLRVLSAQGQRKLALEVFEAFCQELRRELDAEPLESTRALVDSIQQRAVPSTPALPNQPSVPRHNLPAPTTRFIGRKRELAHLTELLAQADTRLVTLIGLGGTGKTRLALELAWRQLEHHADGAWFVPLAGLSSGDLVVPGIASALGFSIAGSSNPKQQLLDYLREKDVLIVLDNFEHLIEAAPLIKDLLEAAPKLKLLATTRVALELSSEWLFDVDGLAYPPRQTSEALEQFDAVKLFLSRAERVSTGMMPTRENLEAVAEICRKVEGLPLALELAASWTRSLNPVQIAQRLVTSLDLLSTQRRDVPERHQSIWAVFDYSWKQLGSLQQNALASMSVFKGGFTLEAAGAVVGAHLALLLSLINHSLVRRHSDGRYHLHELVRQYAAANLRPEDCDSLESGYSHHYLELLDKPAYRLRGSRHLEVKKILISDIENIHSALAIATGHHDWVIIDRSIHRYAIFVGETNQLQQGQRACKTLLETLIGDTDSRNGLEERLLGRCLLEIAMFHRHLGSFVEAKRFFRQSIPILKKHHLYRDLARALSGLALSERATAELENAIDHAREGFLALEKAEDQSFMPEALFNQSVIERDLGNVAQARKLLEDALKIYEAEQDILGIALATSQLALLFDLSEDGDLGKTYTSRAIEIYRQMGDRKNESIGLNNLAIFYYNQGDLQRAKELMIESISIKRDLGNFQGYVASLINLGSILRGEKKFDEAIACFDQTRDFSQKHDIISHEGYSIAEIGETHRQAGEPRRSIPFFQETLELARSSKMVSRLLLVSLSYIAFLFDDIQFGQEAFLLAQFVNLHTSTPPHIRSTTKALLDQLRPSLPPGAADDLEARVTSLTLETVLPVQLAALERGLQATSEPTWV
jgi:predicted ATPase/DNA-binding SARP family transcriptional activator